MPDGVRGGDKALWCCERAIEQGLTSALHWPMTSRHKVQEFDTFVRGGVLRRRSAVDALAYRQRATLTRYRHPPRHDALRDIGRSSMSSLCAFIGSGALMSTDTYNEADRPRLGHLAIRSHSDCRTLADIPAWRYRYLALLLLTDRLTNKKEYVLTGVNGAPLSPLNAWYRGTFRWSASRLA